VATPYASPEPLEPGIACILAANPSPFTFAGTLSYLVGAREVVVIDPGPDLPDHVTALLAAIGGRRLIAITCTHTHRDHSPASRALAAATGAPIIGCAALALDSAGPESEASFDFDYAPRQVLADGEEIIVDGEPLVAVATPGHTSNHLCFAYRGALFSGDHVMGWSTSVVVPPDGDMGDYMASLEKLQRRDDRIYYPAHGPAVTRPRQLVRGMLGHRLSREKQILKRLAAGDNCVHQIVAAAYPGLDPRLVPAAGASVAAHLLDLQRRGMVVHADDQWLKN